MCSEVLFVMITVKSFKKIFLKTVGSFGKDRLQKGGKTMRIILIDDDKKELATLRTCLEDLMGTSLEITEYYSGEEFLAAWEKSKAGSDAKGRNTGEAGTCDLIILDIYMKELTGIDVARKIREKDENVRLVFGTTSNDFAAESYEVHACDYLRKPFTRESVGKMLDRLNLEEMDRVRTICLPDGQMIVLRDIIYIDVDSHRLTIHSKKAGDYVTRLPFGEMEKLLEGYPYFYSPSRGVVVNFYEVSDQKEDVFVMSDGTWLPISRRKAKETLEKYSAFCFQLIREGGV